MKEILNDQSSTEFHNSTMCPHLYSKSSLQVSLTGSRHQSVILVGEPTTFSAPISLLSVVQEAHGCRAQFWLVGDGQGRLRSAPHPTQRPRSAPFDLHFLSSEPHVTLASDSFFRRVCEFAAQRLTVLTPEDRRFESPHGEKVLGATGGTPADRRTPVLGANNIPLSCSCERRVTNVSGNRVNPPK